MRQASLLTLVICVLALVAEPALAGVTIFLSEETTAGSVVVGVPAIDTSSAIFGGSLGVWVIPGTGDEAVLNGISLDLDSDTAEFDFLGTSAVLNPTVTGGGKRWFDDVVSGHNIESVTDQSLSHIIGLALDAGQGGTPGQGLGTGGGTSVFDAGTGAYLFATIDYASEAGAAGTLTLSENLNGILDSMDAAVTGNTITGANLGIVETNFFKDTNLDTLYVNSGPGQADIDFVCANFGPGSVINTDVDRDGDTDQADVDLLVTGPDPPYWGAFFGDTDLSERPPAKPEASIVNRSKRLFSWLSCW